MKIKSLAPCCHFFLATLLGNAAMVTSALAGSYVPPNGILLQQATSISITGASNTVPLFNNATLTDQNTIGESNNNTIKTPSTADPVSTVTGNNYHDETDFTIKGRAGLNYAFTRTYNSAPSATKTDLGLGFGWVHSYGMRLMANNYGACPNCTSAQAPTNGNGLTGSITYTDERGGDHNYLVNQATFAVTPPQGEFDNLALDTPVVGQHTLTFRNGTRYVFQSITGTIKTTPGVSARLLQIADPWGNQLNFTYNAAGRLATVTDNLGISGRSGLVFNYDATNHLQSIADWSGRTWGYSVNSSANLASYTNALGQSIQYGYGATGHNLLTIAKPLRGVQTTFSYYENGRTFQYHDALGNTNALDYDLFRNSTRVTDERGGIRTYEYDSSGRMTRLTEPNGAILQFANQADGLRYSKADGLGYVTQYSYKSDKSFNTASDTFGNVTREQDAMGYTVDTTYGPYDQVASVKDKRGNVVSSSFYTVAGTCAAIGKVNTVSIATLSGVANVKLKSYCWNTDGTLASQTDFISPTDSTKTRVTSYTYDTAAHLSVQSVTVTGWDGTAVTKSFTYDNLGRQKSQTLMRRNNPGGPQTSALTTSTVYDALDRVTQVTDAMGDIFINNFDANGQLWQEIHQYPLGTGGYDIRNVATRTYDGADRVATVTDAMGGITKYTYDAAGNVLTTTDPVGHVLNWQYDAMNQRTQVKDANARSVTTAYDLAGHPVSVTNGNGETVTTAYDAIGRPTSVTDAHGYISQFAFDQNGNRTCSMDANVQAGLQPKNTDGCTLSAVYDELNRPTLMRDALNGTTTTTYDLPGNPVTQLDAEGRVYTWAYDSLGRLAVETDFTGNTTSYLRDEAGNAYQTTNRLGEVEQTTFDLLNRAVKFGYSKDGSYQLFGRDDAGNIGAAVDFSNSSGNLGYYTFSHDTLNRLLSKADSRGRSLSFTWDAAGHMLTKTTFQNSTTSYTYDGAGTLVAAGNPDYLTVNYQYDNAGRILSRVMSSGNRSVYTYDAGGWLIGMSHQDSTGAVVSAETFTRDHVGNITAITVTAGASVGTTTYTLDALYRLTAVAAPAAANSEAFSYDHLGNRITNTKGGTSIGATGSTTRYYNYYPATQTGNPGYTATLNNRLKEIRIGSASGAVDSSFVFDNEGRLTSQTGTTPRTISWDATGRVQSVGAESYIYDASNQRIGRFGGPLGNLSYYLEGDNLESVESAGVLQEKYFRGSGPDELVAGYTTQNGTLTPFLFQHDQITSVTAQTNPNGGTQAAMSYSAFGATQATTGTPISRLQYTGRENDGTGLYYYRARVYDPAIGRFISEDPKRFAAGLNFYAYVGNNPINANDPSGLESLPAAAWGFGIGAATGAATSAITQWAQTGVVDFEAVGWSTLTGGIAGALMTTKAGQTMGGVRAIGASTNVANYLAATPISEWSGTGATLAAVSGMVGATIGGKAPNPYTFLEPSAGLVDKQLIGEMVGLKVLGMGAAGSVVGSIDYTKFIEPADASELPMATQQPIGAFGPTFNDGLSGFQGGSQQGAAGGFLIYPNQPNTNQIQSAYSK